MLQFIHSLSSNGHFINSFFERNDSFSLATRTEFNALPIQNISEEFALAVILCLANRYSLGANFLRRKDFCCKQLR